MAKKTAALFERSTKDKEAGKKEGGKADMKADAKQVKGTKAPPFKKAGK